MPRRAPKSKPDPSTCPVEITLQVLGGKWRAVILFHLCEGTLRFTELRQRMPQISDRTLSQALRELETHGVVARKAYRTVPPRVEYSLTEDGKTLRAITDCMCAWGKRRGRQR